jgi:hypothetical protein
MEGLFTLDSVNPNIVFPVIESHQDTANAPLHCYSRLPMRQLLRHVSTNRGGLWWLSEQDTESSVVPDPQVVAQHLLQHLPNQGDVVVIDALHWMAQNTGNEAVLEALQQLDAMARRTGFIIVFPVEPLAFEPRLWARIRNIAPLFTPASTNTETHRVASEETEDVGQPEAPLTPEEEATITDFTTDEEGTFAGSVVHLVTLPRKGFSYGLLSKRMLQWKRMGFDLSELEPAVSCRDLDRAHALYAATERNITKSIDALRLLEAHASVFSVTELERHRYRLMNLIELDGTNDAIELAISTR